MRFLGIFQGHQELELGQPFLTSVFAKEFYLILCRVGQVGCPDPNLLCSSVFVFYVLVQLSDYFLTHVLL